MKTAHIISFYDRSEFSDEFFTALDKMFSEGRSRVNGYQRVYIRTKKEIEEEELLEHYKLVEDTLISKGYTSKDLILVDNTW